MRPDPVFCFVSAHFDRRLYVAAVAFNGLVTVGWVDSPGGWTPWQIMGLHPSAPQPCFDTAFHADGDTLPLLIQYGTVLYLFVRRRNNKLRVIRKSGVGNWDADWLPLRTDGQVGGRIALALRKLIAGAGTELHMIYAIGFNSLEYRQYVPAGLNFTPLPTWHQWCHVIESVLVPDGAPRLCAVLRTPTEMRIEYVRMSRTEPEPFVLDILLPAGGNLLMQLLDDPGEVICEAEESSGMRTASGDALPNSRRFNITLRVLPAELYFLKVEGLEVGIEYIPNAPPCVVPPTGLISWWAADDNFDDRVSAFHRMPNDVAGFAPGLPGSVFSFEGKGSVRVDPQPELPPSALTIAAWINPFSYKSNRVLEKGGWRVDGSYGLKFNPFGTKGIRFVVWNELAQVIDSDSTVPLCVRTHIAGVFDGSEMCLFVNGLEQNGSQRANMTDNDIPLTIGRASAAEDLFFLGLIDEIQLYDRGLEPPEIPAMFQTGNAGLCRDCPSDRPRLSILRTGNLLDTIWPLCPGWKLEETVTVGGTAIRHRITPPYLTEATQHRVTLQGTTDCRFYRLRKP